MTSFRESGVSKDNDNKNFLGVDFSIQHHPLHVPQTLYRQAGYNQRQQNTCGKDIHVVSLTSGNKSLMISFPLYSIIQTLSP